MVLVAWIGVVYFLLGTHNAVLMWFFCEVSGVVFAVLALALTRHLFRLAKTQKLPVKPTWTTKWHHITSSEVDATAAFAFVFGIVISSDYHLRGLWMDAAVALTIVVLSPVGLMLTRSLNNHSDTPSVAE